MSLLFALLFLAQDPTIDVPDEVLRCADDRSADSALCRALVAQQQGRHGESAEAFEEAAGLAAASDREKSARALVAAGNMWLVSGDPARAASAIDRALAMNLLEGAQLGFAYLDRARAARQAGNLTLAADQLERARGLIAQDPWLWYFGAGLALEREDIVTARHDVARALAIAPDASELLLLAARIEEEAGSSDTARDYLEKAVSAAPDSDAGRAARDLLRRYEQAPAEAPQG